MEEKAKENCIALLATKVQTDKNWFLSLLDDEKQRAQEEAHLSAVLFALRAYHIRAHQDKIKSARAEIERINAEEEHNAENYVKVGNLLASIEDEKKKIEAFKPFFSEPYFARMDLIDSVEGYNRYYIGKKGDVHLEVVDWRAPLARRYYQKSRVNFSINEYDYKTVLRRALQTKDGKLLDFKNEFLSVREYLSAEEIAGRDEEILFDPYLREIIKERKEETGVKDIIRTIQEKQYEIITCPERENFVLQGCAGSGKTMVLLHRLSYLMYNNEEIKPHDVVVITPSDSFNAFIDELSEILELDRVKTITLQEYYLKALLSLGVDIRDKIGEEKETEEYLAFLYSPAFQAETKKTLEKIYEGVYGLFLSDECKEYAEKISADFEKILSGYERIKNAPLRVRRAVLGEIKEKKEGGLYYTKPFRSLMNHCLTVQDFFFGALKSEKIKNPSYFYRQVLRFYKSGVYVVKHFESVCTAAANDLEEMRETLRKEIEELKRYKQKIGETVIYRDADRIKAKEEIQKEGEAVKKRIDEIKRLSDHFFEFFSLLRGDEWFRSIGSGENFVDTLRFFYRETVKKFKKKYKMEKKQLYPSDAYALCTLCDLIGAPLSPRYSFVFVDEAQDISAGEYALLSHINSNAVWNVFGDLKQNMTPYRGVKEWKECFPDFTEYELDRNYRNTNQIVDYVSQTLKIGMKPMGFDGPNVEEIKQSEIFGWLKEDKGTKAVVCSEKTREKYRDSRYKETRKHGVSRTEVNYMTVYESKGLEFTSVVVLDEDMTSEEKYIAYTRALKRLAVSHGEESK